MEDYDHSEEMSYGDLINAFLHQLELEIMLNENDIDL